MKILPPYLNPSSCIGICNPSGFVNLEDLQHGIALLKKNNWHIELGLSTQYVSPNYFAAPDEIRLNDFQSMIDNPNIHCIIFGRGGYGISRIIDSINWSNFMKRPKWICGYSDITLLHTHINSNLNICTLHAPMVKGLHAHETSELYIQFFINTLKGIKQKIHFSIDSSDIQDANIEGELIGGNLTLLAHGIGSNSEVYTDNKILFIEDIDEQWYAIDRMLLQLKRAQKLNKLKALIIGGFTHIKDTVRPFGYNLKNIINTHCKGFDFPIIFNFPTGHQSANASLKIGATYTLSLNQYESFLTEK